MIKCCSNFSARVFVLYSQIVHVVAFELFKPPKSEIQFLASTVDQVVKPHKSVVNSMLQEAPYGVDVHMGIECCKRRPSIKSFYITYC